MLPSLCAINPRSPDHEIIRWSEEPHLKLADALAERSDCQNRIAEVNKRIARAARVQEGEQPPEDPIALLAEHDRLYLRLLELVQSINRTNAAGGPHLRVTRG